MLGNFIPTLFSPDALASFDDARFTTNDLRNMITEAGGATDHSKAVLLVERELRYDPDVEPWEHVTSRINGGSLTVKGYILNADQIVQCLSALTGEPGTKIRTKVRAYMKELRAIITAQQAELVTKDAVIRLLNERHAESAMTGAFLSGIKAARCNLPMSRATIEENNKSHAYYAFVRGKEFFDMYNPRRLYNESDADFYTRVQRELDMEFISPVAPQGTIPLSEAKYQPLKLRPANQAP